MPLMVWDIRVIIPSLFQSNQELEILIKQDGRV